MRRAFTLIEVLVVLAIMSLLVGLLLPAVQRARAAAARVQCVNNVKQITAALHHHELVHGTLPATRLGRGKATWQVVILPYLEQDNLYRHWDLSKDFFEQPREAREGVVKVYLCPLGEPDGAGNESRMSGDRLTSTYQPPPPRVYAGRPGGSSFGGGGSGIGGKLNSMFNIGGGLWFSPGRWIPLPPPQKTKGSGYKGDRPKQPVRVYSIWEFAQLLKYGNRQKQPGRPSGGSYGTPSGPGNLGAPAVPLARPGPGKYPGVISDYAASIDPSGFDEPGPLAPELHGAFESERGYALTEFPDGTSNTLLIGEKHVPKGKRGVAGWDCSAFNGVNPQCYTRAAARVHPLTNDPNNKDWTFGGRHPGGVVFAFADGHVRTIPTNISPAVLELLGRRDDGEVIPNY